MTDANPVLRALLTRRSLKPKLLRDPAPDLETLQACAQAALRAPNRDGLPVCRFILIQEQARDKLSELFREASLRKGAGQEKADRRAGKARKGPMLVACVTRVDANAEATADEQLIAAGAALENFLLALGSFGFGAIVLSDSNRDDPQFKAALGLDETETLAGWITIGTPVENDPEPESRDGAISVWS
jgi:nitroreductase